MVLDEAYATLQLGKQLGMNCKGKEEDVIKKIVQLEKQDTERLSRIKKEDGIG